MRGMFRIASAAAVLALMAAPAMAQGGPGGRQGPAMGRGMMRGGPAAMARNPVTDPTWRERNTAVRALLVVNVYGTDAAQVLKELEEAREAYRRGDRASAYEVVEKLLEQAAKTLTDREKPKPAGGEPAE